MTFKEIHKELALFAVTVIKEARKNLRQKKKITTGKLLKSIKAKIKQEKDYILLNFLMEDYGKFVDKGVKGADPYALPEGARWHGRNKAPNSPYQFGSMKSRGLKQAINRWTIQKGLKGVRDKKTGRFLPRKSMQFMINRSIYLSGLEASMFFTGPYNNLLVRFINKFFKAFTFDVDFALRQQKKGVDYNKI